MLSATFLEHTSATEEPKMACEITLIAKRGSKCLFNAISLKERPSTSLHLAG